MQTDDFDGKTVLITGGTSGAGLEMARQIAGAGGRPNIVLTGRNETRGADAVAAIEAQGAHALFVQGDSADYAACQRIVATALDAYDRLDVVISNGAEGAVGPKPFAEMTPEELRVCYEGRLYPRIYPVHAAIDALKESQGAIVMITTDAARFPTPGEGVIGAVGASIVLLTKTLAKELSRSKVRVNAVAMTLTSDTPAWDRIFAEENFQNRLFSKALEKFPFGRAPNAEEVARLAVFLASADAGQITGQTVSINGGLSFGGW